MKNRNNHIHWPKIDLPDSKVQNYNEYLRLLVYEGAHMRYGEYLTPDCIERIELELNYVQSFSCAQYFIILHDIVKYARENEIWIGAGRGRTVSSIICFCLFIDDIDPIKFGLSSYRVCWKKENFFPDVDIDVSKVKRNDLFDYLRNKYGESAVFRVLNDMTRFSTIHPCSIMIADKEGIDLIPKEKMYTEDEGRDVIVADIHKLQLEERGFLNYDFLSVDHVDITGNVCNLVENRYGKKLDLVNIDITDNKVMSLFCIPDTNDIFLFYYQGMEEFLRIVRPSSFSDLVALYALYRPVMLELIPVYARRKNGVEDVPDYAWANYILEPTYGIPIFRDQIIQILNEVGEMTYEESNKTFRLLIHRKEVEHYKALFMKGCQQKGIQDSEAGMLWKLVSTHAAYTFDKSHASAYTFIAFQQAWLKTYYPSEFHEISSAYYPQKQP